MAYECQIIEDSVYTPISSHNPYRLTTFVVTFPRFILAELNTHRMLSRNSASSRAIPVHKSIQAIIDDIFLPESFIRNQAGMQADAVLDAAEAKRARAIWEIAADEAIWSAQKLDELGLHKALANRILEPFKWHTAVVTATDWDNFFALRTHKDAQPEFRKIAMMMKDVYEHSTPMELRPGEWHTPFVTTGEMSGFNKRATEESNHPLLLSAFTIDWNYWKSVSIGRCARVSFLTHFGKRDPDADVTLTNERLQPSHHLSPFEHVARPFSNEEWNLVVELQNSIRYAIANGAVGGPVDPQHAKYLMRRVEYLGNLRGWHSARMDIPNEENYGAVH
jgi:hypothetical protein